METSYPFYLGGKPVFAPNTSPVTDKYSGEVFATVSVAGAEDIHNAISRAVEAAPRMAALKPWQRQAILDHCVRRFRERAEELALSLCREAGKPIRDARGEVTRLIDTFRIAAEESVRIGGEVMPLEISARASGYFGMWKRVPIGPCSFITPFNFPLNLVAHKVAPAIAAGCPFILKPASLTPIGALIIAEVLAETELPEGSFSVLPCGRDGADLFTTDDRLKLLSFTGSPEVGWNLKARAGRKKVVLELGGNAAVIVEPDADLDDAVNRIIFGAYYQSGQSCVSVQRILAHAKVYDELRAKLTARVSKLRSGDPKDESVFIGPIISRKEADRIASWVESAVSAGARLLCGGDRKGEIIEAALLENVAHDHPLWSKEVFGPVAVMEEYTDFSEALRLVNDSEFGLQAGVFTRDIYKAHRAWNELEAGAVLINEVPSWRVDNMPYGGVKDSGLGREGVRFAIEDMTELRLFILRGVQQA